MTEDRRPPTEDQLDELTTAAIPMLEHLGELAMERHDFDKTTKPKKPKPKSERRYGVRSDRLGLTDSIEVRLTHEFAPHWCALGDGQRARNDPVIVIVERYPGASGRLELHLCPSHHTNLVNTYRRRALIANGPALHFAGRKIIAINPQPLDVIDVMKSGASPFL